MIDTDVEMVDVGVVSSKSNNSIIEITDPEQIRELNERRKLTTKLRKPRNSKPSQQSPEKIDLRGNFKVHIVFKLHS